MNASSPIKRLFSSLLLACLLSACAFGRADNRADTLTTFDYSGAPSYRNVLASPGAGAHYRVKAYTLKNEGTLKTTVSWTDDTGVPPFDTVTLTPGETKTASNPAGIFTTHNNSALRVTFGANYQHISGDVTTVVE